MAVSKVENSDLRISLGVLENALPGMKDIFNYLNFNDKTSMDECPDILNALLNIKYLDPTQKLGFFFYETLKNVLNSEQIINYKSNVKHSFMGKAPSLNNKKDLEKNLKAIYTTIDRAFKLYNERLLNKNQEHKFDVDESTALKRIESSSSEKSLIDGHIVTTDIGRGVFIKNKDEVIGKLGESYTNKEVKKALLKLTNERPLSETEKDIELPLNSKAHCIYIHGGQNIYADLLKAIVSSVTLRANPDVQFISGRMTAQILWTTDKNDEVVGIVDTHILSLASENQIAYYLNSSKVLQEQEEADFAETPLGKLYYKGQVKFEDKKYTSLLDSKMTIRLAKNEKNQDEGYHFKIESTLIKPTVDAFILINQDKFVDEENTQDLVQKY